MQRHYYLLLWTGCCLLIAIALYMQYMMNLVPCALCMTQRVFIIAVGVVALAAWLSKASSSKTFPIVGIVLAAIGGGFSIRHIWLQNLPEDLAPACGPTLGYLLENVPFVEALAVLLQGDGNCAESVWSFLGLTIPGWTLVAFIGLLLLNAFILFLSITRKKQETNTV